MYRREEGSDATFKHHLETYGEQAVFGYKDFVPLFKGERFDAPEWADLFKQAGARFVVPVAEHHDGFAMYQTDLSRWNAAEMGPRRDIIGELSRSVRERGLVFGLSSHRAEHWWFFNGGRKFPSDVQNPEFADLYGPAQEASHGLEDVDKYPQPDSEFLDDWLTRTSELVDKYQPQLVWFDWWIEQPAFAPYLQKFAAFLYNRGAQWDKGVAINYKNEAFPDGAAVLDVERGQLAQIRPFFWQTDTSVSNNSWSYIHNHDYKTTDSIIDDLIDIVSKNGALLLNVGPKSDGTIPDREQQMLREIGAWLGVNGEAIYETRPWRIYGEGPTEVVSGAFSDTKRQAFTGQDIRFTTRGETLYALVLDWPGEHLVIQSLKAQTKLASGEVTGVRLLGHDGQLQWTRDERGLVVEMPTQKPCDFAYALKIEGLQFEPFVFADADVKNLSEQVSKSMV